ncbi:YidC/Oxa1 family insertase periplasmic-domain containing protein [Blattabacterium cuenoti]|uniref:YidC/Oxa1 family insertase periplasmic-domain containing protein n=1 Tax=Blattabacterium cuenoti TaxID=1653831 RepID=UPI00163CA063|nr:YidC/Oxa1 family insertase periplasmic-domain containing protein [Blattabacterium cuenoti]
MNNKNVDRSSIIGLFLILFIIIFFTYFFNGNKKNELKKELQEKNKDFFFKKNNKHNLGFTFIENKVLRIKVSNKGGEIDDVLLKKYKKYDPISLNHSQDLHLITNYSLNYKVFIPNIKGYNIDSTNLIFRPFLFSDKSKKILIMKAPLPDGDEKNFIEYIYVIGKNTEYHVDFFIRIKNSLFLIKKGVPFNLEQKIFSFEKDRNWENSYTYVTYSISKKNNSSNTFIKNLSEKNIDEKKISNLNWIAHKQQFFTSIFVPKKPLDDIFVRSENFFSGKCLKKIQWKTFINKKNNEEINFSFRLYFGPLDFNILKKYKNNYENIVPFGWGFLKWINKYFFLLIFQFLEKTNLNYGIIIILMTIVVKLILSPITYRQYKLNAIMKLIRPEIDKINKKYHNDPPLIKQKALMELYQKVGINPMSGCMSALFQIPIFYSLFKFFPTVINLRGKSFLWVEDLTSYDSILKLPFYIPFYGDHVSLLTLLYSIALLIYTKTNNNGIGINDNDIIQKNNGKGEIIPNMNFMLYLMPIIMLLFINSYASALSLYYFTSNVINIGFLFFIKGIMLNDDKILMRIREKKLKKHISLKNLIKKLINKNTTTL